VEERPKGGYKERTVSRLSCQGVPCAMTSRPRTQGTHSQSFALLRFGLGCTLARLPMKAELDHCPSAAMLELLLSEQLTGPDLDSVETHVESCGSCQEQLDQIIGKTHIRIDHAGANHAYEMQPDEDFLCRLKHLPLPHVRVSERTLPADLQPLSDDSAAKDVIDRFENRRLGQYEILGTLGKGNMGVVYKALHTELDKIVALKVLPASSADEVDIARFKNEARAAGRLDHPNIVTAHDAGQAEGVYFLVM